MKELYCKLVGVNFCSCDATFLQLAFQNSLLHTCNFSDMSLERTPFTQCTVKDTYFTGCNLTQANFTSSLNYAINPSHNTLTKAKFSQPEVYSLLDHLEIIIC